jgi:hypothetical protein
LSSLGNIADLSVDETKSLDGIPLDLGLGRVLWVRQAGGLNRAVAWKGSEIAEELETELSGMHPRERDYHLHMEISARLLVARWEGFEDAAGSPLDYSPTLGLELFRASPETLSRVQELATSADAYRLAEDKKK